MMTVGQLSKWLPTGRLIGDPTTVIDRVHSDTRSLKHGDLFVALVGERFDAHDFLPQAGSLGAVAALGQRGIAEAGLSGVEVADSRRALGELASAWRAQFDLSLIAVAGSNGKTTTTQMIASALRACTPGAVLATEGNFNNDIGVPLTLLKLGSEHRLAVVELGMNHPGEISQLARMVRPTIALVNNAQREHMEFMVSVEAIAQENGAVIDALPADGIAVFPEGDRYTPLWRSVAGARRCITFGEQGAAADVQLQAADWSGDVWQVRACTPRGELGFRLQVAGRHNVRNALAATACAVAAGVGLDAIESGLSLFQPIKGRSAAFRLFVGDRPVTVVDDSYNANPDSVRAAIEVLAELPGPHLLVLGDMGEVGDHGPAFHSEVGVLAHSRGIEKLFTHGIQAAVTAQAFGAGSHFGDIGSLSAAVAAELPVVGSVLIKGSRFMQMERVVAAIVAAPGAVMREAHAA